MLAILLGDDTNALFHFQDGALQERFFLRELDALIDLVSNYKGVAKIKVMSISAKSECIIKNLPWISSVVASEVELSSHSDFPLRHCFIVDRLHNKYMFVFPAFTQEQLKFLSIMDKIVKWFSVAQIECAAILRDLSKGMARESGAEDVLLLDTEVSGFIVFIYNSDGLVHCEGVNTMGEVDASIVSGFVLQHLECEVLKNRPNARVFLIARREIVASLVSSLKKVSNVIALDPNEALIVLGVNADAIEPDEKADAMIAGLLCAKKFPLKLRVPTYNPGSDKGFWEKYSYKILSVILVAGLFWEVSIAYSCYFDYRKLLAKAEALSAKYYTLRRSIGALARDDEILQMYSLIGGFSSSPVPYINSLKVTNSDAQKLTWNFLYSLDELMSAKGDSQVEICIQKDRSAKPNESDCKVEVLK